MAWFTEETHSDPSNWGGQHHGIKHSNFSKVKKHVMCDRQVCRGIDKVAFLQVLIHTWKHGL